jgi:hypothetical protein
VPFKVTDDPSHTVEDGDAVALTTGDGFTVTSNVCGADIPQPLTALRLIVPLVVDAVALIVFVVEVPVHPEGKDQT